MNFKPNKLNVIVGILGFIIFLIGLATQCRVLGSDGSLHSCFIEAITSPVPILISLIIGIFVYVIASFFAKVK